MGPQAQRRRRWRRRTDGWGTRLAGGPGSSRRLSGLVRIDDPDDPRIEPYLNLRDRDLAGRHSGFIAEGDVVVGVLARSRRMRLLSVLIADNRLDRLGGALAPIAPDTPVYVASQAVMDNIVGFHIHRGILALGERQPPAAADDLLADLPGDAQVIALFGISNHDNVGGVFRNAAAFGVSAVLLDPECCDPLYRKAIRVSVGASLIVPYARLVAGQEPVTMLQRHGFRVLALSPRIGMSLRELPPTTRAALLVGSEGRGLSDELLSRAETVRIPMTEGFDSLNLATASGIALHHLRRNHDDWESKAATP